MGTPPGTLLLRATFCALLLTCHDSFSSASGDVGELIGGRCPAGDGDGDSDLSGEAAGM